MGVNVPYRTLEAPKSEPVRCCGACHSAVGGCPHLCYFVAPNGRRIEAGRQDDGSTTAPLVKLDGRWTFESPADDPANRRKLTLRESVKTLFGD